MTSQAGSKKEVQDHVGSPDKCLVSLELDVEQNWFPHPQGSHPIGCKTPDTAP